MVDKTLLTWLTLLAFFVPMHSIAAYQVHILGDPSDVHRPSSRGLMLMGGSARKELEIDIKNLY